MIKNRTLSLAFLVALSIHLCLLFFVTVVVVPANFRIIKPATVSFLGPILEKTAFEMLLDQKVPQGGVRELGSLYVDANSLRRSAGDPGSVNFHDIFAGTRSENISPSNEELFLDKFMPDFITDNPEPGRAGPAGAGRSGGSEDFSIEGPASSREILSLPRPPVIEKGIDRNQGLFTCELKFKVLPDGTVEGASLLASSGYPAADMAAISYLSGFKFLPLAAEERGAPSEGRIRLNLRTR